METGLETEQPSVAEASNPSFDVSSSAFKSPVISGVNGGISKLVDLRAALSSFRVHLSYRQFYWSG